MVQLGGFITSILSFLTNSEKLVKSIPDSFTEDLTKKASPKSEKVWKLQNLLLKQDLILSVNKYYFQI